MFKIVKKIKDKLDNMNKKGEHRDSIQKKNDICDRIISGEAFEDRRREIRRFDIERRHA